MCFVAALFVGSNLLAGCHTRTLWDCDLDWDRCTETETETETEDGDGNGDGDEAQTGHVTSAAQSPSTKA